MRPTVRSNPGHATVKPTRRSRKFSGGCALENDTEDRDRTDTGFTNGPGSGTQSAPTFHQPSHENMLPGSIRETPWGIPLVPGSVQPDGWPALLIVDDDKRILEALVRYFEKRGFQVAAAPTMEEAMVIYHRRKTWMLVISDFHLPDGTGTEFACWIREQPGVPPPFLLMSGSSHGEAMCAGEDFMAKPFLMADLEQRVRELLCRPR